MAEFATLTDLKAHLNIASSANDDELALILDAASDVVAGLLGRDYSPLAVEERIGPTSGGTVLLHGRPIVGDVLLDGGAVTGFSVNRAAGLLYDVPASYETVTAAYTVDEGAVPAAVTMATLVIAAHLWETQRGTSPTALQAADTNEFVPGQGFTIPNRAKELLEPFIVKPQIA